MPKLRVTIMQKQVATFDSGDLPANLIREVLNKNDGTFDGNWSLGDVDRNEQFTTESILVEEVGK